MRAVLRKWLICKLCSKGYGCFGCGWKYDKSGDQGYAIGSAALAALVAAAYTEDLRTFFPLLNVQFEAGSLCCRRSLRWRPSALPLCGSRYDGCRTGGSRSGD